MSLRRVGRIVLPVVAVALVVLWAAPVGAAPGDLADWDQPVVQASFDRIQFEQWVTLSFPPDRAELLMEAGGRLPLLVEVDAPRSHGRSALRYEVEPASLGLTPHTSISARWRLTFGAALEEVGPLMQITYEDDRYPWKAAVRSLHGLTIRVHWYEDSAGQTDPALSAAVAGVTRAEEAFGVLQTQPIDVFLYADERSFQEATGSTQDFVGSMDPYTGATFVISRGPIDEVTASTIRHEVIHVVFKTAFGIPSSQPPRWLNEGSASFLMDLYGGSWFRVPIARAAQAGKVIPLSRLGYTFPSVTDGIELAYNEGASAVEYLVETHGLQALAELGGAYRSGMSDSEAFTSVLGVDVAGFQAAWLAHLEGQPLKAFGPVPAKPAVPRAQPAANVPAAAPVAEPAGGWGLAMRLLLASLAALLVEIEILRFHGGRAVVRRPVGWRSWVPDDPGRHGASVPSLPPPPEPPPFPPPPDP